jgi:hypothetical protein
MEGDKERKEITEMIKFANELINHRLSWFGTLQGLLLASLAFAWGNSLPIIIVCALCGLGAFVAISIGISTIHANIAIDDLEARFDSIKRLGSHEIQTIGRRSRSGLWWLMPGYFIPWLFLAGWLVILTSYLLQAE